MSAFRVGVVSREMQSYRLIKRLYPHWKTETGHRFPILAVSDGYEVTFIRDPLGYTTTSTGEMWRIRTSIYFRMFTALRQRARTNERIQS